MRVLFIIPTLRAGGAERVVVTLLQHLDRTHFDLTLAVVDTRHAVFLDDIPTEVRLIDLGCRRVLYSLPKIITLIWRLRPQVVFSTLGHLNLALAICRWALPQRSRYIARETSIVSENIRQEKHPKLWYWAYRWLYARYDLVIAQSVYMAQDLVENYAVPIQKVRVINNPLDHTKILQRSVDRQVFPVQCSQVKLIAVGRLATEKGFDLLIQAIAQCRDLPIDLTILGDGPQHSTLTSLVQQQALTDRIHLIGFQQNPYPYLAQADAFILSSRYEGFPNVVLEALACGTPVIATPAIGGTREILEGVPDCIIANAISAEALALAIRSWMHGPRSRVAADSVARFAVDKIVAQYAAAFSVEAHRA